MSQMSITVLAARQPQRMGPGSGRVVQVKRAVCVIFFFFLLFSPLIFRSCHGRLVAIPGTQSSATPTTASQTPRTSQVPCRSSGSKLDTRVFYITRMLLCCDPILAAHKGHLPFKGSVQGSESGGAICITDSGLTYVSVD